MSPRIKVQPDTGLPRLPQPIKWRQSWVLALATSIGALATAVTAITMCAFTLVSHERHRYTAISDAAALGYVRSFMTEFTSPDPFHANDYTDRVLAHATGEFAEQYRRNQNEILIGVARSEPSTGIVLDAGVSRRHDDGSVEVLTVTKITSKSPDGKLQADRLNRWVVTATEEGDQWKISALVPVI